MALIGDVLQSFRESAVDQSLGLLSPPATELTVAQVGVGSPPTLPFTNYFVKLAYRTPWGETLPGAESASITVDATHAIQVSANPALSSLPPSATAIVIYFGTAIGTENQFVVVTPSQLPFTLTANGASGQPRVRSTAYLPDSDGSSISAFALYRWLNKGLEEAAALCGGGMPDYSGVASVSGQGVYTLLGNWWKLDQGWYDGYPMAVTGTTAVFRKNKVTGNYAMALVVPSVSDRVLIEVWPQPSRTSGVSTLTNPIGAGDLGAIALTAGATSIVGQADGLLQIGSEIVMYNTVSPTSATLILRGLGGTLPQAWPAGTQVNELNLFFHGFRTAPTYSVGQANLPLNVPPGWQSALDHYLLHRFRNIEKDSKRAADEYKMFETIIKAQPMNKPVGGPRQIQVGGGRGTETYPGLGGYFGGVIVP